MIIVLHEWEKFFYRILQKFTPTWYLQKFFGYDKAQIKREAKKNDSPDSNDKKQQQHSAEQQKPDPEATRETEENSGITVSVDPAGDHQDALRTFVYCPTAHRHPIFLPE